MIYICSFTSELKTTTLLYIFTRKIGNNLIRKKTIHNDSVLARHLMETRTINIYTVN